MKINKNGFTLIELLAVIVILAIIALIATPVVLNIINDARDSAVINSTENYMHAVDLAVMNENLKREFKPTTCTILSNGNLNCEGYEEEIQIKIKGEKPESGSITFKNKKIETASLYISNNTVDFIDGEYKIKRTSKSTKTYKEGEVVYFNVDKGGKCDNYTEAQSAAGVKSGCMKFYVLNVYDDSLDLILDHNVHNETNWEINGGNTSTLLYASTYKWKGTITPKNYTATSYDGQSYTIDYSKYNDISTEPYKARLPEIEEIISKVKWYQKLSNEDKENWMVLFTSAYEQYQSNIIFTALEELGFTEEQVEADDSLIEIVYGKMFELLRAGDFSIPSWLISNLEPESAYWTATMDKTYTSSAVIWAVGNLMDDIGRLGTQSKSSDDLGIRPVIRVLKSTVENKGQESSIQQEEIVLQEVYFDVTNGNVCTTYTEAQSATGVATGCMKFYVLNKTSERATLILDHDIYEQIRWCENCSYPNSTTIIDTLQSLSSSWNGVLTLESYTAPNGNVYTNRKARLPKFEELIQHTRWYKKLEDKTSIKDKYEIGYKKFEQELLFEYFANNSNEEKALEFAKKSDVALPLQLQTDKSYWLEDQYLFNDSTNKFYLVSSYIIGNKVATAYDGMNLRPVIEISADLLK